MSLPELTRTAVLLGECDVLGALGEVSPYLPAAAYARLHAAIYTLAAEAVKQEREAIAAMFDDSPNAEMFRQDVAEAIRVRATMPQCEEKPCES